MSRQNGFDVAYERHWGVWLWTLTFTNRLGGIEEIAHGRNLFKSSADAAAQSWIRVYLRRSGLLNY